MKRRLFFRKTTLGLGALSLTTLLNSCNGCDNDTPSIGPVEPDTGSGNENNLRTRKALHLLSSNSDTILAFKAAVSAMKQLPASDPLNWNNQAAIHQANCQHGTPYFLPWHRAYLYYFEEACRELSGYENFALPYWDWTEFPQVPEVMWGDNNSLNNPTREINSISIASSEFVGTNEINSMMSTSNFSVFGSSSGAQGRLESGAHNYIHRFISGNMVTMLSPLDPIFWCHHSNVDRLWATWNENGNLNPSASDWLNHEFTNHFYSRQKQLTSIKVSEVTSTSQLNYTYENQNQVLVAAMMTRGSEIEDLVLERADVKVFNSDVRDAPLELKTEAIQDIERTLEPAKKSKDRITIKLNDIKPPKNEDYIVRVFANCTYLSKDTPIDDPHYIGSLTFFGGNHGNHHKGHDNHNHHNMDHDSGINYLFDITDKYQKLSSLSQSKNKLDIQVVAVPLKDNALTEATVIAPKSIEIIRSKFK